MYNLLYATLTNYEALHGGTIIDTWVVKTWAGASVLVSLFVREFGLAATAGGLLGG